MGRPRRVAVIGAGHYHAAWYPAYLRILADQHLAIVGIHDPDMGVAQNLARRFASVAYDDAQRMVETTKPEFVVALGRHVDMPATFRYLVDTGIAFLMEKPWATDLETLRELVTLAESRQAWVAAPFPMRYAYWAQVARAMARRGELGALSHISYRMIRPGVARYVAQGCPWMLDKDLAGGGVLLNLGCHGFDLCRFLTAEEPAVVAAVTSHAVCRLDIEDYAFVTLRTPSGVIVHNEVGYTLPAEQGSDDERRLSAERALLREVGGGVHILGPGRDEVLAPPPGYVSGWERVVVECLDQLARGEPPPITARDCYGAIAPIFAAYRLAGER